MSEPVRFRDRGEGAPPGAAELLRAARKPRSMTSEERARSAAKVAALAAVPATLGGAAAASKTLSGKTLAVLGVCGLVGIGIGIGVFSLQRGSRVVEETTSTSATSATSATSTKAAPTTTAAASASIVATTSSASIAPTAIAAPSITATATVPPAPTIASASPSTTNAASASASAGDTLEREAALLESARGQLETDPAGALATCEKHRSQFPAGQLAAERETIAIDALRRLHRDAEAKQRGEAFIAANPKSFYVARVRALLEGL